MGPRHHDAQPAELLAAHHDARAFPYLRDGALDALLEAEGCLALSAVQGRVELEPREGPSRQEVGRGLQEEPGYQARLADEQAHVARKFEDAGAFGLGGLFSLPVFDQLNADHQAEAANLLDQLRVTGRESRELGLKIFALGGGVAQKFFFLDHINSSDPRGAGDRVAAKGAAMSPG